MALSGWVAVLDAPNGQVVAVRDLGPRPVDVKRALVLPITEVKPALSAGQEYGNPTITHDGDTATRTWPVLTSKTDAERDQLQINSQLAASGDPLRGLALYVFGLAKGTITVNPALTKAQFVNAVVALMR